MAEIIEEYAQQVATEQGAANNGTPTDYTPTEPAGALESVTAPQYDASKVTETLGQEVSTEPKNYIDKATSTVAGQLETLLQSDSPYIQQAKNRALEMSQARGWGGSTMAEESGQLAAIKSALPIATQDASTYAQSDLDTQRFQQGLETSKGQAIIESGLKEQDYYFQGMENYLQRQHEAGVLEDKQVFEETQNTFNRAHQTAIQNDNQDHVIKIEGIQNQNKVALETLSNAHDTAMKDLQLDADQTRAFSSGVSQIMHDYLSSVQNLMTDPSFLELSGLDLEKTINNMQTFAMNQMSFLGSIYQESDIDSWIDAAFPPVQDIG